MTQAALKKEVLKLVDPHVSEALASIRDVIKENLEQGLGNFQANQGTDSKAVKGEQNEESVLSLYDYPHSSPKGTFEPLKKTLVENVMSLKEETMSAIQNKEADVFYLTDVLEADGSITTLEKKEKTAMSDAEKDLVDMPVKGTMDAPVTTDVAAESAPFILETTPETDIASSLASPATIAESAAAFSELANMAKQLSSASPEATTKPVTPQNTGGHTVDALMRELLRPMLKEWLDAHLPSLVKWLVTEQIEKMMKDQLGFAPSSTAAPVAPQAEQGTETPSFVQPASTETPAEPAMEEAKADPTADMDFDTPAA